ncbi:MAG: hypothetical protein M5U34_16480 [Chloroflexi bacterium]|nr:hypothetical protein [Chloroflexota bacterium]
MPTKNSEDQEAIQFDSEKPTAFTFSQLSQWVIWQMAKQKGKVQAGAVRPARVDAAWYPAIIQPKEKSVQVYGYLDIRFESPEEAAEWVAKQTA